MKLVKILDTVAWVGVALSAAYVFGLILTLVTK
jgi:hypothetical protein